MDVVVVGASGLLGSNVVAAALDRGQSVGCAYHTSEPAFEGPCRQLDIRRTDQFEELVTECEPRHVVNCAAMTDVDECERRPERAREINATAPGDLASVCSDHDIEFTHVSTDYVFDGEGTHRYCERDEPNPIQAYGRSKLAGERFATAAGESALILRLSFVYGLDRSGESPVLSGFPAWVRSQLRDGEMVSLYTDQRVTPSRAGAAATTLLDLRASGADGVYHVASRSCVTPYKFGRRLADEAGVDADTLVPTSSEDDSRTAARPSNACLSVERVTERLGRPQPTLESDVATLSEYLYI